MGAGNAQILPSRSDGEVAGPPLGRRGEGGPAPPHELAAAAPPIASPTGGFSDDLPITRISTTGGGSAVARCHPRCMRGNSMIATWRTIRRSALLPSAARAADEPCCDPQPRVRVCGRPNTSGAPRAGSRLAGGASPTPRAGGDVNRPPNRGVGPDGHREGVHLRFVEARGLIRPSAASRIRREHYQHQGVGNGDKVVSAPAMRTVCSPAGLRLRHWPCRRGYICSPCHRDERAALALGSTRLPLPTIVPHGLIEPLARWPIVAQTISEKRAVLAAFFGQARMSGSRNRRLVICNRSTGCPALAQPRQQLVRSCLEMPFTRSSALGKRIGDHLRPGGARGCRRRRISGRGWGSCTGGGDRERLPSSNPADTCSWRRALGCHRRADDRRNSRRASSTAGRRSRCGREE